MKVQTYAPGTVIANCYQIAVPVGAGGMGVVYYAFDHGQDGLPIALKTFHPHLLSDRGARDSFLQEGRAWLELGRHPHIVEAYAIDRVEGRGEVFIAAELISPVEGKRNASLRHWVQPGGMAWEQAFLFGLQIVWGMQHAVRVHPGLVHRDLKPENVLVGADKVAEEDVQRVRVTDFGLVAGLSKVATQLTAADAEEPLILGHSVYAPDAGGTPSYMAPEQWLGEGLDERTDLYAWGLIMEELLSGQMAVKGKSASEIRQQHLAGVKLSLLEHVPAGLRALVDLCASPEKSSRPANWAVLEGDLRELWREMKGTLLPEGGWRMEEDGTAVQERMMRAYNTIGISYADIGRYDDAQGHFEKSLEIALGLGDRAVEAAVLGNLGVAYQSIGQNEQALAHFEESLAIARELGDRAVEGRALGNMGNLYESTGQYERALAHHEQNLAIVRELGDRTGEGASLGNLGVVYRSTGQYEQALAYHEQRLAIARELGDRLGEGRALGNMGNLYESTGQYERALAHHEQQLAIAHELGDRLGEGVALGSMGNVYLSTGQYEQALPYHEQDLAIAREIGDRDGEGRALGNIGVVYASTGQYERSLAYFERHLAIARELGDRDGERSALGNLGNAFAITGQYEHALAYFEQLLAIARELGDRDGERSALGNLGIVYQTIGHYEGARAYYEQYLAIAREPSDVSGAAIARLNLAAIVAQLGDLPTGMSHALEAQRIFEQNGQPQHAQKAAELITQIEQVMRQS